MVSAVRWVTSNRTIWKCLLPMQNGALSSVFSSRGLPLQGRAGFDLQRQDNSMLPPFCGHPLRTHQTYPSTRYFA
uniref:Uncharacterized protein n=1 Tax=Peromyscus maniculatus bairdii TaxID=230844 RepID=A0A8C8URP0_PERMB